MIKADDKVKYEGADKAEKFTYFEELKARVDLLQESFDEIVAILKANDLKRKQTIEPEYFNEDKVYDKLGED